MTATTAPEITDEELRKRAVVTDRVVVRCPHPYVPACVKVVEVGPAGLDAAREALCMHLQDRHHWEHGTAWRLADGAEPVEVVVLVGEPPLVLGGPQPDSERGSTRQPAVWRDGPPVAG